MPAFVAEIVAIVTLGLVVRENDAYKQAGVLVVLREDNRLFS